MRGCGAATSPQRGQATGGFTQARYSETRNDIGPAYSELPAPMLPFWCACVFEVAAAIKHAASTATLSFFFLNIWNSLFVCWHGSTEKQFIIPRASISSCLFVRCIPYA